MLILHNIFQTQRLIIRHAKTADVAALLKLVNQDDFIEYIGDKEIYTPQQALEYIKSSFIRAHKAQGFGPYVITLADNRFVGVIGFYQRKVLNCSDLGFAILKDHQQQGYAFEAASTLIQHRAQFGITTLSAITSSQNKGSQALLIKLGFNRLGNIIINDNKTLVDLFVIP